MNSSLNYFFYWNIFYSNTKYSFSCCSTDFLYSDFENVFYSFTSYYPCFFCFIHSTFSCMIFYLSLIIIFFSICLFSSSLISCVSFLTSLFIQSRSSFPFFILSSCLSSWFRSLMVSFYTLLFHFKVFLSPFNSLIFACMLLSSFSKSSMCLQSTRTWSSFTRSFIFYCIFTISDYHECKSL